MPTKPDTAVDALAAVALANVGREYPYHLLHLVRGDADVLPPRRLHPIFHGAYDWHSCAHMHWTLARCLRLDPRIGLAPQIGAHFDDRFTATAVAGECDYFAGSGRAAFERPYGWAWLLQLAAELDALAGHMPAATRWRDALAPLVAQVIGRFLDWLPRADFPVRAGTHGNSAFALVLALRYARRLRHAGLESAIADRALAWYGNDRRYPAHYEPGGDDFLSGGLCEALAMARLLPAEAWREWWSAFAPDEQALASWLAPVRVADPTDSKIVHLHGLNLSRAWCWRELQPLLPAAMQPVAAQAAAVHRRASSAASTAGEYVGTHWLASFALLALTGESIDGC
jgi:hypothetical protein